MYRHSLSIAGIVIIALIVVVVATFHTQIVKASIAIFSPSNCYSAAATSTLSYMTPGTATTTVTCNLGLEGAREAVVIAELTASSSASTWSFGVEESMDGIDWFPVAPNQAASTTAPFLLTNKQTFSYSHQTTSLGGLISAPPSNRNHVSFSVPTRMKRLRVFSSMSSSTVITGDTPNGAIWLQIVPRMEIN